MTDFQPSSGNNEARLPVSELPESAVRQVEVAGEPVAVCNVEGEFYAIHDTCTHAEASLSEGDLSGDELVCPLHFATFNVRTGEATGGPAEEPCRPYDVRREGDELVITRRPLGQRT